ncbi:MAG: Hint domain-containing protein [Thermogemmata sp.]
MVTSARWGVRAINAAQGVSGLLSAQEQWEQGNYLAAALDATGSVLNFTQLFKACFTGDVRLLARGSWGEGWRRIDEITIDDEVLSRDEHDPSGPLAWKKVEETFERVGLMLELEVGGRIIGTTAEHPIYVLGKGWTAAGELKPGDRIVGLDPRESVAVTALRLTSRQEKLYNLRVADYHTYFVGDAHWDFSVWAHNAYKDVKEFNPDQDALIQLAKEQKKREVTMDDVEILRKWPKNTMYYSGVLRYIYIVKK